MCQARSCKVVGLCKRETNAGDAVIILEETDLNRNKCFGDYFRHTSQCQGQECPYDDDCTTAMVTRAVMAKGVAVITEENDE